MVIHSLKRRFWGQKWGSKRGSGPQKGPFFHLYKGLAWSDPGFWFCWPWRFWQDVPRSGFPR